MARFTTLFGHGITYRFKTPFEFSLQRQQVRRIAPADLSWIAQWLCVFVPSLRRLLKSHKDALVLIDEKTIKLADSDAQVSNLASANGQWMKLAKKRKDIMSRHGLNDNS